MGVIAGLVPATPITLARQYHMIGVAGTSPAMTRYWGVSPGRSHTGTILQKNGIGAVTPRCP